MSLLSPFAVAALNLHPQLHRRDSACKQPPLRYNKSLDAEKSPLANPPVMTGEGRSVSPSPTRLFCPRNAPYFTQEYQELCPGGESTTSVSAQHKFTWHKEAAQVFHCTPLNSHHSVHADNSPQSLATPKLGVGEKYPESVLNPQATTTFYSGKENEVIYPNYTLKSAKESKPKLRDLMIKL